MAETLAAKTCTPCKGGIPPLTPQQVEPPRSEVPDWGVRDDANRLERKFQFRNFAEALQFVQHVGTMAEAERHHPDISFGWGYATVSLQTKKIKGLHENDFIMAAKIVRLFGDKVRRSSTRLEVESRPLSACARVARSPRAQDKELGRVRRLSGSCNIRLSDRPPCLVFN